MNILITGGNSATALKVAKAIKHHQPLFADYGEVPNIPISGYRLVSLGQWNPEVTAHKLLSCCLDHQIDILIPLRGEEIWPLAKASTLFAEFGITVLLPQPEVLASYLGKEKSQILLGVLNGESFIGSSAPSGKSPNGLFYLNLPSNNMQLVTI